MNTQLFSQTNQMIELCCDYLSVQCIWLYHHFVSCTFQSKSTLKSCLNVKELLAQNRCNIWSLSDQTGQMIELCCEYLSVWCNWLYVLTMSCAHLIMSHMHFESRCSHLNFRYCTCFKQKVPWHSGNSRAWIHTDMCMWHKNIQPNALYR